jgi:hypothetical protein
VACAVHVEEVHDCCDWEIDSFHGEEADSSQRQRRWPVQAGVPVEKDFDCVVGSSWKGQTIDSGRLRDGEVPGGLGVEKDYSIDHVAYEKDSWILLERHRGWEEGGGLSCWDCWTVGVAILRLRLGP